MIKQTKATPQQQFAAPGDEPAVLLDAKGNASINWDRVHALAATWQPNVPSNPMAVILCKVLAPLDPSRQPADTLKSIVAWFDAARPSWTDRQRATQLGVHYEEVGEAASGFGDQSLANQLSAIGRMYKSSLDLSMTAVPDRKEALDGLCDQIVTAIGVARSHGFDILGALREVDRSNWTKPENGVFQYDADGKIKKGLFYDPPRLAPFLPELPTT